VYVVVSSSSRVVIEEKRREREKKKKLFHQKWHRATAAAMSSIGLRLVQVDRTSPNVGTKKEIFAYQRLL
jgi:hypothetical protein